MNRELNEALACRKCAKDIGPHKTAFREAARWAASFPSEADVERAQEAMLKFGPMASLVGMRAALEAVALPTTSKSQSKSELVVEAVALDPKEGP
jgi:hypothetical protein